MARSSNEASSILRCEALGLDSFILFIRYVTYNLVQRAESLAVAVVGSPVAIVRKERQNHWARNMKKNTNKFQKYHLNWLLKRLNFVMYRKGRQSCSKQLSKWNKEAVQMALFRFELIVCNQIWSS
ncbi:hypothetical protein K1719_042785 [Acacia pycnantha]|nr:hypothetical protein K1719_042785 [Acacia pycnantha]